jgi:nitroreductase
MAEFIDVLQQRRSVRRFEERPVATETLTAVLEALRWSPSWANTQCWEIVVVTDAAIRSRLQQTISKGNPATKAVGAVPVVLAVCGRLKASGYYKDQVTTKFGDWFLFDLGIATQSLCLAAHDLGLGTVVVGLFDHDKAAEILKLPKETHELVALIPMGYPAHQPSAPKRREVSEFVHYETF